MLGYPPFQPTNTARKGVGFPGLIDDVIAVLPLQDMTAFLDNKMETGEFFKTLLTAIRPPEFTVNIHCVLMLCTYLCMASHKSNPSSVLRCILDLYHILPWVTWNAVTIVEGIP